MVALRAKWLRRVMDEVNSMPSQALVTFSYRSTGEGELSLVARLCGWRKWKQFNTDLKEKQEGLRGNQHARRFFVLVAVVAAVGRGKI